MIPKSLRFKCERCGYLKKRPGKCVACGKIADFDNLMGGGVESRHAPVSLVSGPAGNARRGTRPDSRISDRPAHHSNFPVPVLAELNVSVQLHDASGKAREAQSWQAAKAEVTSKSRGGEYFNTSELTCQSAGSPRGGNNALT